MRGRSAEQHAAASEQLCQNLPSLAGLRGDLPLLAFFPLTREEPDLRPWLAAELARGRVLGLPKIKGDFFLPRQVFSLETLARSDFGTLEPADDAPFLAIETLGAVLVPGLGFQVRNGLRLGRGGGFYDRFLAQLAPGCLRVGIGFDSQLLDHLPHEAHDQRVDGVITESGWHPAEIDRADREG